MSPKVSIVIPAYNTERYISKAIETALSQTLKEIEVLVVDDASTDNTLDVVRRFNDERIRILASPHKTNQGVCNARNRGAQEACGDWIAILDSDDWYEDNRLDKLMGFSADFPIYDLIADNLKFVSHDGNILPETLLSARRQEVETFMDIDAKSLLQENFRNDNLHISVVKPIIRRRFIIDNGVSYNEEVGASDDYFFYLSCLVDWARMAVLSDPLYYYRLRRPGSITTTSIRSLSHFSGCKKGTELFINNSKVRESKPELLPLLERSLMEIDDQLLYHHFAQSLKDKQLRASITLAFTHPKLISIFLKRLPSIMKYRLGIKTY